MTGTYSLRDLHLTRLSTNPGSAGAVYLGCDETAETEHGHRIEVSNGDLTDLTDLAGGVPAGSTDAMRSAITATLIIGYPGGITAQLSIPFTRVHPQCIRWSVGVLLGARLGRARVVVDSGASIADYARGWELQVIDDAAAGSRSPPCGTGQLTTIDVGRIRTRFVRIESTGSTWRWWSVADLRFYD